MDTPVRRGKIELKRGGGLMANQVGKRYLCGKCNSEFIVTRAGEGTLKCCGTPVEIKK
jgi:hypothetical protein